MFLVKEGKVNASAAIQVLFPKFILGKLSALQLAEEENLMVQTDESEAEQLVKKFLLSLTKEVNGF